MANKEDPGIAALIYDYLLKKDANLAKVFQKKINAVSFIYTTFSIMHIIVNLTHACLITPRGIPPFTCAPRGLHALRLLCTIFKAVF